jgi:hypothetical protein
MRNRIGAVLLIGAAAVLAVGLSATSSFAASPGWIITPGGAFTATAGKTTLADTVTGNALSCKSSKAAGTFKSGSGLPGKNIGSISSFSFSNCTGPLGLTFTVTASAFPWSVNFTGFKKSGGLVTGTITGIHATLSGPECSTVVDGTRATADDGQVRFSFNGSTLKILPTGGNLHVYNVSGCLGLLNSGDAVSYAATYTVTPEQHISP